MSDLPCHRWPLMVLSLAGEALPTAPAITGRLFVAQETDSDPLAERWEAQHYGRSVRKRVFVARSQETDA